MPGLEKLKRGVDFHLNAFEKMGATIKADEQMFEAYCPKGRLHGAAITLDPRWRSVGTTINIMLAASLADGITIIQNASSDPTVIACTNFLKAMGARITGEGTNCIVIEGVQRLHGAIGYIPPDPIETGTWLIAIAITKGDVTVVNAPINDLQSVLNTLLAVGAEVRVTRHSVNVQLFERPKLTQITTSPAPGFPSDLHPPFAASLSIAEGVSVIIETIHQNRFRYAKELGEMDAQLIVREPACWPKILSTA